VESNSVCNHTSDNKIGRPRSGNPICLSRVWLQTVLDDTKSYYQLIIKIYIKSSYTVSMVIETKVVIGWFIWQHKMWLVDLNCNFECDWLIELSDNKLSDNNLTSELVENKSFLTNHNRGNCNFYDKSYYYMARFCGAIWLLIVEHHSSAIPIGRLRPTKTEQKAI